MGALDKIRRSIAVHIPGSEINIAMSKRRLEKELRAQGYSRSHATAEASRRLKP